MEKAETIQLFTFIGAFALLILYPMPDYAASFVGLVILGLYLKALFQSKPSLDSNQFLLNTENLSDAFLLTSLDGKVRFLNAACRNLFPDHENASTIAQLFDDWHGELTDRSQADEILETINGAPQMQFTETLNFKDGRVFERSTRAIENGGARTWILRDISYLETAGRDSEMHSTLLEADAARTAELAEQLYHAKDALEAKQAELTKLANTDSLTGLLNRRRFTALGEQAIENTPTDNIWVIMLDIDHFKRINDTYGHAAGDTAIRDFADIIRNRVGTDGFIGRMGGEEFAAILENYEMNSAIKMAEEIRQETAAHITVHESEKFRFTASLGVAQWHKGEITIEAALDRSDQALYSAKAYGRNRVVGYETT